MNRFVAFVVALSLTACTGSAFTEALFDAEFNVGTDAGRDAPAPDAIGSIDAAASDAADASTDRDNEGDAASPDAHDASDALPADAGEAGAIRACPSTSVYYTKAQEALAGDRPRYCPPTCGSGECCYGAIVCVQE